MSEPAIRRKFLKFDPVENSNKFWLIEYWPDTMTTRTSWGRVGDTGQKKEFATTNTSYVERKISEKLNKGYSEVDLHRPDVEVIQPDTTTTAVVMDKQVQDFLNLVFREAGETIKSYLSVGIDALSQDQIAKGRDILSDLASSRTPSYANRLVKQFFNTIPTQLPRRIDDSEWERIVQSFVSDLNEQEVHLQQLEAGLAAHNIQKVGGNDYLSQLGSIEVKTMDSGSTSYGQIADYILRTSGGGYKLHSLFAITIPSERREYENEVCGKSVIASMFHGTKSANVRHILRTGLIIPQHAANGSRFGRGIYFADQAKRSLNYCGGYDRRRFLFITDVALGNMAVLDRDNCYLTSAPAPYDSIRGIKSYSGMDEFIIYRPSQQTIRAVALVE